MSPKRLTGPAGEDHPDSTSPPDPQPQAGSAHHRAPIPDEEACLRAIHQAARLVAMGLLKPAQANAIRASYREILQYHQRSQAQRGEGTLPTADVFRLAREFPEMLSLFEPLLTEEQIAILMSEVADQ